MKLPTNRNTTHKKQNQSKWSKNKYTWITAIVVLLMVFGMEFIYALNGASEPFTIRFLNLIYILLGFIVMTYSYAKHSEHKVRYTEGLKLCLRAGIKFGLLFFPLLFIFLALDHSDLERFRSAGAFENQYNPMAVFGALLVEITSFIAVAAVVSAFVTGMVTKKKTKFK